MKSNKERQAKHREKLSHGGLFKRRDFWLHPDDEPLLRRLEKECRLKRLGEIGEEK
jgi:hypothetical protein